jgi:hypothetical protein
MSKKKKKKPKQNHCRQQTLPQLAEKAPSHLLAHVISDEIIKMRNDSLLAYVVPLIINC